MSNGLCDAAGFKRDNKEKNKRKAEQLRKRKAEKAEQVYLFYFLLLWIMLDNIWPCSLVALQRTLPLVCF